MKSLINYHFGSKVPRAGVGVAYLQSDPVFSTQAMTLIDTSAIIAQNSFFQQDTVIDLDENNLDYFVDKRGFILTDKFNSAGKPLYFKHILEKDIFEDTGVQTDVTVVDSDGNQISSSFFMYDCGKKAIYHALPPEDGKVYFVIYPRANENNQVIEPRYKELLEVHSALEEADADDIDECGLDPDPDGYLLTELDGQPHFFRLRVPRPSKYSLRYTEAGLLKLHVAQKDQQDPWYIEVQNATILTTHNTQDTFLRYTIPEFDTQAFYPFPPIKLETDVEVSEIAEGVINLGFDNIIVTNKTPIDIIISDMNGNRMRAFTTDQTKSGKQVGGVFWEIDGIISVDEATGRVKIYRSIKPGEQATANFFHKTDRFTYTGWNFNPSFNDSALGSRVAILVKPNATDCFYSISHVVINSDTTIESASDEDINDWVDGSKTFDDLVSEWVYIPGTSEDNLNNYMMLGVVSAHTPVSPDQSVIFDARNRGGGLIDDLREQSINLIPSASNNWDVGNYDGPPVPIHGGILIYLPETLLSTYTEKQIRALASKYSAAGTYIVIRYYT